MIAPILLLLIFAESAVGFVHSEKMAVGIVLRVQPNSHFESCAKDMVLYAKRKGANTLRQGQEPLPLLKGGDRGEGMSI